MMIKKQCLLVLSMLAGFAVSAGAGEHMRPAEFFVGQTVVNTNVAGIGTEFTQEQRINNWTDNPGMEPLSVKEYWDIDGGGTDATGDYVTCSTRRWDTISSGYFDGAHYRLYRENFVEGKIEKIREGTIPAGGYIAAGYMEVGSGALTIKAYAPNTEVTDDHYIENGQTWYYAVKAKDTEGKSSGFSAAVAGVTPQSGVTNGPRIKTQSVSNPTVGNNYSQFVRLEALGGDLPLSWTVSSGALPAGMSMDSSGKISGTCPSANEITFVARVTDSSSNAHERTFTMFRSAPSGDGVNPAAPSNVVVEAHDGFVHIRWDPPAETDIDTYQLFRSRKPESEHMERIYLEGSGALPQEEDLLFVGLETMDIPPKEMRSVRVLQYQEDASLWVKRGNDTTREIVSHPGVLPAQFISEYPGEGCLKVSTPTEEMFAIREYKSSGTGHDYWSVGMFPTGQTYRMECWVYGEGMSDNTLRFYYPNYVDETVTGIVNGAWTKLSADFAVTNWIPNAEGIFGPEFQFEGPGTVYIDNAVVYNINDPQGPCHFSKDIFDLWTDYIGPSNLTQKGIMRVRYVGDPFKHVMNPSVMSMRTGSRTRGAFKASEMHIHDMFLEALASGSTPETRVLPWVIASLEWTESDYVNLVEYLAGPAGTPYGDLRIEQRGGVTTPWTDEFRKVFIEMGNEPWNTGYFFGFRGGFSEDSGRTYGRWCQYIWDHVWSNSVYMSDTIKPVLGGWSSATSTNGFTAAARRECPRAQHVSMAMYIGGWEAGAEGQVGGITWSDDGVQQWPVWLDRSGKSVIDRHVGLQESMAASGHPYEWLVYESGPSYMQDGLNGVSLTEEQQETSRRYGRSLAAAIGALDYYMYGMYRNIQEMTFFQFVQDRLNWASHTYVHEGYRPHPSFQALSMFNKNASLDSMLVTTPLNMPTFDLEYEKDGETVVKPDMELASAYVFREGDRYSMILFNKKVDGVHNGYDFGDGSTPMMVHLPFSDPASITLYKMEGDPRETNMDQMNFQVETQAIDTVHFSQDFAVNENTGGVTNGLPVGGLFIYVFEGCSSDALPANPQAFVKKAMGQGEVQNASVLNEVRFTVVFDRPVTGFDSAGDVALSGTALPQTAVIEEVATGFGTIYEVVVSGMAMPGIVTLSIPSGAAQSADTGSGNDPSTSLDNNVTVEFPDGMTLLEWEFINKDDFPGSADQDPEATAYHARILPASLGIGPGVTLYPDNKWYNDDGFVLDDLNAASLDLDDYIGWIVTPTNGWEMSMDTIRLGAYCKDEVTYNVELRWSIDGFASYETVTLTPTNPLMGGGLSSTAGTEMQGALPYALQSTTNAVEFRFYIWNAGDHGQGGIGKLGDDEVDLIIRGLVAEAGSGAADDDSDGLPNKWEQYHFGGPTNADPNATASNGVNTVKECYIAGLNPADAQARFQIDSLTFSPQNVLQWQGISGHSYTVYWTSNLLAGFQPLETNLPWAPGVFTDTTHSAEDKGFYKIEVKLAP